ncbi:MAG: NADH:flavin oxidoreductase, partial [Dehalococcoidia bacterium]|nr:NADH:flavin oxidoreductase [Dehalococcoidia bacterium]
MKNRIVLAPMGLGKMTEPDGNWGERVREHYLARIRGGVGLITTSVVYVTQQLEAHTRTTLNLDSDLHLESLRTIIELAHLHGAKVSVQLSGGLGQGVHLYVLDPNAPPVSASATPYRFDPSVLCRPLAIEEVEEIVQDFGRAAKRCQMAGADMVEVHSHNGFILDAFMSARWNQRSDKYGGSPEKRLTLAREVVSCIKEQTGGDFPVIYRFPLDHYVKDGRTADESLPICQELEAMGVDALHIDAGCYESAWWLAPSMYQPRGTTVDLAARAKTVVKIPVIAVGKLHYPLLAEKVLQEGKADFIALGRGLLADPEWPIKVRENRLDDILHCIGDNEGCFGEHHASRLRSCTVNPTCGH